MTKLEIKGTFDGAAAWDLRSQIEKLDGQLPVAEIELDFTDVREYYDFGVAVLAHGLAQRRPQLPRVRMRGLKAHQVRMFKYFGVDAEAT